MTSIDDISNLTFYNSAIITATIPVGLWIMKKLSDLCTFKTQQEQKEIDKEKYENQKS